MKPLYFGSAERQLFGVYHPASDDAASESGVVICPPWQDEYNRSHRALKNLASSLATAGIPALRFDYFGTGDSAGETGEASPLDHASDVVTAARELRELSGTRTVTFVGRGVGALCALVAAESQPAQNLVLWEPVVSGSDYLLELRRLDRRQRIIRMQSRRRDDLGTLLGYPFAPKLETVFAELDARKAKPKVSGRCLVIVRERLSHHKSLMRALEAHGIPCELQAMEYDQRPTDDRVEETVLLAAKPLASIQKWMTENP